MVQCNAKIQWSGGKRCQREALPGKTKCRSHGSGGCRSAAGRTAIAAARSRGLNDTRANRVSYQMAVSELYLLARIAGLVWVGRPPKKKVMAR